MDAEPVSPQVPGDPHRIDLYHTLGGMDTCQALAVAFYAHVEHDPVLRPLYPPTLKGCPINALAAFFTQFFGGPCEYTSRRWHLSLREFHLRFAIGPKEREAWLTNMFLALDDVKIQEPARSALRWFFVQSSAYFMNQHSGATDDSLSLQEHLQRDQVEQEASHLHQEIQERWQAQQMLEEMVAAVHQGNAEVALAVIEAPMMQAFFLRDQGAFLSLLVILSCSGHPASVDHARQKLIATPGLVHERYTYDLTLLHELAGQGNLAMVELLLQLGADPNAQNHQGQTPLYWVSNGSPGAYGAEVVHLLVRHGANVNAREKLKQCTSLHMAARRGNIPVAGALLDCGAEREALDKLGETPLHRAVRCGKTEMVAFLLARGADVHMQGKRGLAAWQVARGPAMKRLLQPSLEK
ncbi:MAG TPA: ankyrin repeat domain-containing protein [Ktedonobacteraceae bacterium]|nr:ankyrin repeat domain-containing protein [Ktedonobacteraceae bacterium]